MTCEPFRRAISDRFDEVVAVADPALEDHLAGCDGCRSFERQLESVSRQLHLQPVGATPDVAGSVRRQLEARASTTPAPPRPRRPSVQWQRLLPVASVFAVAFALAASFVGLAGPPDARAVDVASLVLENQSTLRSVSARVEVTEHGWHPAVPVRTYDGELRYLAPEALSLELHDTTAYPDEAWAPNDVELVVDGARARGSGRHPCPVAGLPACIPQRPQVREVVGREPFDADAPVPLDLVLPVASFAIGGAEVSLGDDVIGGRAATGVQVTAAQISRLLDGIQRYGNWRPVHPTDPVTVWLDAEVGVPLLVEVRAGAGTVRQRWAASVGLVDEPGSHLLTWQLHDLRINDHLETPALGLVDDAVSVDRGFRDGDPTHDLGPLDTDVPTPGWLPDGMALHRQGRRGDTAVVSYADGRAWVAIRSTTTWDRPRLFGEAAGVVRRVDLDGAGVGYLAEGGDRILLHGDGVDVEVVGSLATDQLERIAASLGVQGQPVPSHWEEGATSTLDEAVRTWPRLLTVPEPLDGYVGPAVSTSEAGVVQSFVGSGDRAFTLSTVQGDTLGPPVDAVVLAFEIRGGLARYTPSRGTLEWVEDGHVHTLRSRTLEVAELLEIAARLDIGAQLEEAR